MPHELEEIRLASPPDQQKKKKLEWKNVNKYKKWYNSIRKEIMITIWYASTLYFSVMEYLHTPTLCTVK